MIDLFESLVYGVATFWGHIGYAVVWLCTLLFVAALSYVALGPVGIIIGVPAFFFWKANRRR